MTDLPGQSLSVAVWVRAHGSLVGFPMTCKSNPKLQHPLVKFDRARYDQNMAVFRSRPATKWSASPDVVHMLVGSRKSAASMGHTLVCDPSLPENTIIAARKR